MEVLWKHTVSTDSRVKHPYLCGKCAFPQNLHTRKLGEIPVIYAVYHKCFAVSFTKDFKANFFLKDHQMTVFKLIKINEGTRRKCSPSFWCYLFIIFFVYNCYLRLFACFYVLQYLCLILRSELEERRELIANLSNITSNHDQAVMYTFCDM